MTNFGNMQPRVIKQQLYPGGNSNLESTRMRDILELCTLPSLVIEKIFVYANLGALLQLRLVSRRLKTLVDLSSRFNGVIGDIQVNLDSSILEVFMETAHDLPFSNFYIRHSWENEALQIFYIASPQLQRFLELFGPTIRKLRVSRMFCCTLDIELCFFQSLLNLQELHIDTLEGCYCNEGLFGLSNDLEIKPQRVPFIEGRPGVKQLVVDCEADSGEYLLEWIKLCPTLEFINIPNTSGSKAIGASVYEPKNELSTMEMDSSTWFYPYILRLGADGHLKQLRTLDFNDNIMKIDICSPDEIRFFLKMVANKNIRLLNVPSEFLWTVRDQLPSALRQVEEQTVTFFGLPWALKDEGFVNLEIYNFASEFENEEESERNADLQILRLPALKKISARICFFCYPSGNLEKVQDLLDELFQPDKPRVTVSELEITQSATDLRFPFYNLGRSFPNLTCLCLTFDFYTRPSKVKRSMKFISKMHLLEELTLSVPGRVGNWAFLKGKRGEPYLLQGLQRLRKFSFFCNPPYLYFGKKHWTGSAYGMLRMLSEMSLTHLHIVGRYWTKKTQEWIKRLVDRPLGQSILYVRLPLMVKEGTEPAEHLRSLEMMERVAHRNRIAKGLTSTSFEQFKAFANLNHFRFDKHWWEHENS